MQKVELPFVNPFDQNYDNGEPQPVVAKTPACAELFLNMYDLPKGSNRNNFILDIGGQVMIQNCSGLTFVGAGSYNWYIPNVNPYNQTITFWSSNTSSFWTVIVPEGQYSTSAQAIAAVVAALNTISGSSGLTFSSSAVLATNPDAYILSASGGNYYFKNDCTAITQGDTMFNLPTDQTPTATKVVGPMTLKYTVFVDICSTTLTKYSKLRTIATNARGNIFERAYIPGLDWGNTFYVPKNTEIIRYAFRPQETVNSVDIQLYDSHGNPLYIPPSQADKFVLAITIRMEL